MTATQRFVDFTFIGCGSCSRFQHSSLSRVFFRRYYGERLCILAVLGYAGMRTGRRLGRLFGQAPSRIDPNEGKEEATTASNRPEPVGTTAKPPDRPGSPVAAVKSPRSKQVSKRVRRL